MEIKSYYVSTAIILSAFVNCAAYAQEISPQNNQSQGIEDIVVTAERRETNLQNVSQSITALGAEKLAILGVQSVGDIDSFVPGLKISPGNAPNIFIRGVGTSLVSVTGDAGVAVHIDGVFQVRSTAVNAGFFDLERVEVLKGPQGTLYGRGSVGGSINVITAAPKMEYAGAASGEVGNYNLIRGQGMLNIPLDEETKTAVRVAVMGERRDGFASNGMDDLNNVGARLRVRTSPIERLTIDLSGVMYSSRNRGLAFYPARDYPQGEADVDNWKTWLDETPGFNEFTIREAYASIAYDMDFATLTFIPSVTTINKYQNSVGIDGPPAFSDYTISDLRSNAKMQELRLSSPSSSPIQWVVGLYHLKEHNNYNVANGAVVGVEVTDSRSVFGQVTVPLTEALRVVGGARYTEEKKKRSTTSGLFFSDKWNPKNFRASVEYDVADASMLYGTFATGFKAGGFFVAAPPNSYDPETVNSWEIGSKNRFLDNTLQVNASAYFSKYRKYQVNVTIPRTFPGSTSQGVFNGGDAEIKGAEIDIIYELTPSDRFEVAANYTDAKFVSLISNSTSAQVGDTLPFSPKYSVNLAYTRSFEIDPGKINLRLETRLEGAVWLRLKHTEFTRQKAYSKSNATLTYTPNEGDWSVSAYVRNIEDEAVRGYIQDAPDYEVYTLGTPRTYGMMVSKKF